mgnify:CR=1 FL=1
MSKMKKRTKRILKAIFIPIACITIFFLLNFLLNAAAEPRDHVSPDYAKTDLNSLLAKDSLSDSDYELLYRQTGLAGLPCKICSCCRMAEKKSNNSRQIFSVRHGLNANKTPSPPFRKA